MPPCLDTFWPLKAVLFHLLTSFFRQKLAKSSAHPSPLITLSLVHFPGFPGECPLRALFWSDSMPYLYSCWATSVRLWCVNLISRWADLLAIYGQWDSSQHQRVFGISYGWAKRDSFLFFFLRSEEIKAFVNNGCTPFMPTRLQPTSGQGVVKTIFLFVHP